VVAPAVVAAAPTTGRSVRPTTLAAMFAAAAVLALAAATRMPATTTVLGLACFGIVHNVLELRYVTGRFAQVLSGRFLRLLLILITGIALCRLLPAGPASRSAEVLLAYGLLGYACWHALRDRPVRLAAAGALLLLAATASLRFPAYHFVMLSHLHNLVPLVFLWEWSRTMTAGRTVFLGAQLAWVLVIPGLLLSGLLDPWLGAGPSAVRAFGSPPTHTLAAAYTPPAWLDSAMALRFLAVFAFLQTMHYVVWVWFMPRHAPSATAAFERRIPALGGWRAWTLGAAGAALLAVLFATDYTSGKTIYASVASYHAYLEFPVLLILILGLERPHP
jgi:hypothetical protein